MPSMGTAPADVAGLQGRQGSGRPVLPTLDEERLDDDHPKRFADARTAFEEAYAAAQETLRAQTRDAEQKDTEQQPAKKPRAEDGMSEVSAGFESVAGMSTTTLPTEAKKAIEQAREAHKRVATAKPKEKSKGQSG